MARVSTALVIVAALCWGLSGGLGGVLRHAIDGVAREATKGMVADDRHDAISGTLQPRQVE